MDSPPPLLSCSLQADPVSSFCSPPGTRVWGSPAHIPWRLRWLLPNVTSLTHPCTVGPRQPALALTLRHTGRSKFYCKIRNQYKKM